MGQDVTDKKQISELLNNATKLSRVGSWEVNLINNTIFWSDVTYEIHLVDKNTKLDLATAINYYKPEYRDFVQQTIGECMQTESTFDFEAILITAKNTEIWVRAIGRSEFIDNKCVKIFGSFQDIHERKLAELHLEAISNNIPGVIFQYQLFTDGTDRLLHLSEGSQWLWNVSPKDGIADNSLIWNQINAGGDIDKVQESIGKSMQNLTDWYCRFRCKLTDGKIKWLEGLGTPKLQPNGSVIWDSLILDISQLVETENLLTNATSLARLGTWEMTLKENQNYNMYWSGITKEILEMDVNLEPTLEFGLSLHQEPSLSQASKDMNTLMTTGKSFDSEYNLLSAKGNNIWVRCIGNAEFKDGIPIKIFGSYQDITALKIAEINQLKTLQEKNNILESIGDAFFAVDNNWIVTYWNKQAEYILGKNKKDILGKHLWEEYADAIDSDFYRNYHKALETMEVINFEEFYKTLGQWYDVSVYPSEEGLSVYFKDITIRKIALMKITEANERFEKVTEAVSDAIWDWNISDNTLFLGNGFYKIFGHDIEKTSVSLESWETNLHPDDLERASNSLNKAIEDPKCLKWQEEYQFKKANQTYVYVIDKGIIIRDDQGNAVRMVGSMADQTYFKQNEKALLELNDLLKNRLGELKIAYDELEQFTYIASHDLQEPLRMITSFMDQLKRKYGENLDAKAHQYIEFAVDGARRMKQIILDLLEYSRAGKILEDKQLLNTATVLDEYKILRRKVIADKQVKLTSDPLPSVLIYKTPFVQVLNNIIDNAIKYCKKEINPIIHIYCKEEENLYQFCISDNGIGIDSMYFNKIFILFQRLHNRDEFEGTGIGLSVVKKHVESWNGNMWLESEINKGTQFYFTVPKH